ncbi:hypothetical protein SRHO_G00247890 [Serrasalmus rhombeus]
MKSATVTVTTATEGTTGTASARAERRRRDTEREDTERRRRAGTSRRAAVAEGGTTVKKVTAIADTNTRSPRGAKKARSQARSEQLTRRTKRPWSNCPDREVISQSRIYRVYWNSWIPLAESEDCPKGTSLYSRWIGLSSGLKGCSRTLQPNHHLLKLLVPLAAVF